MDDVRRLKRNAYMRAWKCKNKKSVNRTNQRWKDANREQVRAAGRRYVTGPGYKVRWLNVTKARAKKKGLPFNLTLDDLRVPACCPVLGIRLKSRRGAFHDRSPSIDRTVPELGYVKGNVTIMSYRANRIKCHATLDELKAIIAYMERQSAT